MHRQTLGGSNRVKIVSRSTYLVHQGLLLDKQMSHVLNDQLTPLYAFGVLSYAQVDMTRLLLNIYAEVLDAAQMALT